MYPRYWKALIAFMLSVTYLVAAYGNDGLLDQQPTQILDVPSTPVAVDMTAAIAAYLSNDMLEIVSLRDGRVLDSIATIPLPLVSIEFSSDGNLVGGIGRDGQGRVWSVKTRRLVAGFRVEFQPMSCRFSPKATVFAVGGLREICAYDIGTATVRSITKQQLYYASSLDFSRDGERLASAALYPGPAIAIWDLQSGAEALTLDGFQFQERELVRNGRVAKTITWCPNDRRFSAIRYSSTGDCIVATALADGQPESWCGQVRFWDAQSGMLIGEFELPQISPLSVNFVRKDKVLVVGKTAGVDSIGTRGVLVLLDRLTGETLRQDVLTVERLDYVWINSDTGSVAAVSGNDRKILVWEDVGH